MDVHDPWADADEAKHEYDLTLTQTPVQGAYDALVLAVGHTKFSDMPSGAIRTFGKRAVSPILDVKGIMPDGEGIFRI